MTINCTPTNIYPGGQSAHRKEIQFRHCRGRAPNANGHRWRTPACQLRYTITSQWSGGFTADVILKNNGRTPINGWRVAWTFAGKQVITNLWNGAKTQNGQSVQVANLGYNNLIGTNGGTQGFGFQGTFGGTNAVPTSFTVNGSSCGMMTNAQALEPGAGDVTVTWGAYLPLLSTAE